MSKNKSAKEQVQSSQANHIVDSENDFAAEFGEELYGAQARVAYEQHEQDKNEEPSN